MVPVAFNNIRGKTLEEQTVSISAKEWRKKPIVGWLASRLAAYQQAIGACCPIVNKQIRKPVRHARDEVRCDTAIHNQPPVGADHWPIRTSRCLVARIKRVTG